MDMLEEDDNLLANVDEIFEEPPDTNVDTDEDSANEDEGEMVCNLNADPRITASEIRCFIAILILSGYNPLPSKRLYWDLKDDIHNKMVADSMERDRFLKIQRFIHMADNTQIDQSDKAWKLRPLMIAMKEKCLANFQPVQDMSYDESMIRYYGPHGCKQFIRGKPIRFGYKMWSLNSKDGYLVDCDLYQGNDPREDVEISKYEFVGFSSNFRLRGNWHYSRKSNRKILPSEQKTRFSKKEAGV
ncbi:hypothetical protein JTB14_029292 [Gonioctena quinquepunctata]|nr:hypothetical protein JTB14_029292 [Gonioctena quinquepunctata]